MVKYDAALDLAFAALADPTRRAMVARLAEGGDMSISALGEPFAMSLPAVLKHVNVLADAGLVKRSKHGRTVVCRLETEPMREAIEWLERYERFWSARLDALANFLETEPCPSAPSPASPSSAGSKRPSNASGTRGPRGKR